MITGFNTNVRHGGRVYHVQTEDSGRNHPHVISHVYYGGNILASEKRGYAEQLAAAELPELVRRLMEEQHQAMIARLKGGDFDALIAERLDAGAEPAAPSAAPSAPAAAPQAPAAAEKPLDEMILEYLVKKARERAAVRPARPSSSRE
jgi:hypothetical protein